MQQRLASRILMLYSQRGLEIGNLVCQIFTGCG
jgi:hypothetical protein